VNDDWRLRVDLDDEAHGFPLTERLRSLKLDDQVRARLGGEVIVTRDGSRMFLYAATEEGAREAERVVGEVVAEDGLTAEVAVERWHPVEGAWRDPSVPLPHDAAQEAEEYRRREDRERDEAVREGDTDWDIRVTLHHHDAVSALAAQLELEGLWVVRRWHHLMVKALTEEQAAELAERIRSEAPPDADVHVEVSDPEIAGYTSNPFAVFGGLGG
jgi:hypothetical protein